MRTEESIVINRRRQVMSDAESWLGGISLDTIPSDTFDTYERSMVPAVFGPWAERLVDDAELRPGERVLDLACATGIVARVAARRVGPTGSVTGLDLLAGMLEAARAVSLGVEPEIEWVEGNALEMPLPDGSFDVILCQQGLQFFPDEVAALKECRRVLSPGGRALVSVWGPIEHSPAVAALQRALERHAPEVAGFANTSHHLRLLASSGLVRTTRDGTRVIYRLSSPTVLKLWAALRDVAAEHVGEVERLAKDYLGNRDGLEPVPRTELSRRLKRGDVVVVDVRPAPEFDSGHIAGARSIPIGELARRLKELPKATEIVAYCRGRYCVFADDAVRLLRRKGYRAARLEDGYPEWREQGLPTGTGHGDRPA